MDVYTAIASRRTIRDFAEKEIAPDIVETIIDAGLKAPTNDHMRNWEFVIVNDKNVRAKILQVMPQCNDVNGLLQSWGLTDTIQKNMYLEAVPKQSAMIYNAGCLILPFFKVKTPLLQPTSLSSLNCFASIWCCIQNMLLAATAQGIFGVTRIPMANESAHIQAVIKHPDEYVLPCYLALGYPAENAMVNRQKEVFAKDKIHCNAW